MSGKESVKKRNLIILIVLLAVLAAAYAGVIKYKDYLADQKAVREEADQIKITDLNNIEKIEYDNGTDQLSFVKKDDIWYYEKDQDFPLVQSYLTALEGTAGQLTAVRKLEDADELQVYGLKEPAGSVKLTAADNTEVTLLIGNKSEENYYLCIEGEDIVYTVEAGLMEDIGYSLYDMVDFQPYPVIAAENINRLEITYNKKKSVYEKQKAEGAGEQDAADGEVQAEEAAWTVDRDGEAEEVSGSEMTELLDAAGNIIISGCVNYKASKDELKEYGLLEPAARIKVTWETEGEESQVVLMIGGQENETGNYYVMMDDSEAVGIVEASKLEAFLK